MLHVPTQTLLYHALTDAVFNREREWQAWYTKHHQFQYLFYSVQVLTTLHYTILHCTPQSVFTNKSTHFWGPNHELHASQTHPTQIAERGVR